MMRRRAFLSSGILASFGVMASRCNLSDIEGRNKVNIPGYLADYKELFVQNPREAALKWFRDARYGLFMHYGLYSLLGRGEWIMYNENIPIKDYELLKTSFTAQNFDTDFITDLALEAGMRYINLTARHHDSFCLFDSRMSDYNSMQSPAKRDLVGELAEQCEKKGLGLFLYYSYALDWRHPYFYPRNYYPIARPDYPDPESVYKFRTDDDFINYINFVHAQIKELLTNYGPLAGIWFDPIMGFYARPHLFPIHETYELVRQLQPQTLISFKQGATGDEDFAAPERQGRSLAETVRNRVGEKEGEIAASAWEKNKNKHNEICDTMQSGAWGYRKADDGKHITPDDVMKKLEAADAQNCNLLLNTGPLPEGNIHATDTMTLRKSGKLIMKQGQ